MTTEEKNKAILNCGDDYDDILDIQYGKTGTPERDSFDREAEAFILAERLKEERRNAGLTQEASRTGRRTCSFPRSSRFFRDSASGSASPSCNRYVSALTSTPSEGGQFPAISSHLRKVSAIALLGKSGNGRTPRRCNRLKINAQQNNDVLSSHKKLPVSTRWFRNILTIV